LAQRDISHAGGTDIGILGTLYGREQNSMEEEQFSNINVWTHPLITTTHVSVLDSV